MESWSQGYFAESGYTYGFYREAAPNHLAWAALLGGAVAPVQRFSYLDLGCGQGFGLCALAAQYPESRFVGVDFMPEHVAHGRLLASALGLSNIQFMEADFLETQQQASLDETFDYAVAHGIATWVSDSVRSALIKTAARWLKPAGLFYCAYNTKPGWLAAEPFQRMVLQHQQRSGSGEMALRKAQETFQALRASGASFFEHQPRFVQRLDKMSKLDPAYALQEYNNQSWAPAYVADVMRQMAVHKLGYLVSANITDNFDDLLPQEAARLVGQQQDTEMRETVRDLVVNQSFRRDIYTKGTCRQWSHQHYQSLVETEFVLVHDPRHTKAQDPFEFKTPTGRVQCDAVTYGKLLDKLAPNPQSMAELFNLRGERTVEALQPQLLTLALLMDAGIVAPRADGNVEGSVRFNQHVARQVTLGAPYRHLAVPAAGSALPVSEFELLAIAQGIGANETVTVKNVAVYLQQQRRAIVFDGKEMSTESDMVAALNVLLRPYFTHGMATLRRLGGLQKPAASKP